MCARILCLRAHVNRDILAWKQFFFSFFLLPCILVYLINVLLLLILRSSRRGSRDQRSLSLTLKRLISSVATFLYILCFFLKSLFFVFLLLIFLHMLVNYQMDLFIRDALHTSRSDASCFRETSLARPTVLQQKGALLSFRKQTNTRLAPDK